MAAAKVVRLPPLPTIRDIVRLYRLKAMRQLSQNFLMDERLTDRIVRAAGNIAGGHVCEVGPGPGGITRSIIRAGPARFVVVEKDPRFLSTLQMLGESVPREIDFEVVIGDILQTQIDRLFPDAPKKSFDENPPNVHIIGNLPFSVSTILIIRWLQAMSTQSNAWSLGRTRMTLTFQKEVAERMVAPPLSKQRCRLSLMCQNWCKVDHQFTIGGGAFVPKPDVDVGVVTFTPLKRPIIPLDFKMLEKLFRHFFHTKQKYSITCAKTLFPPELRDQLAGRMFFEADLDPQIRPIQITIGEFKRLAYAYEAITKEHPGVYEYDHRARKVLPAEELKI